VTINTDNVNVGTVCQSTTFQNSSNSISTVEDQRVERKKESGQSKKGSLMEDRIIYTDGGHSSHSNQNAPKFHCDTSVIPRTSRSLLLNTFFLYQN
jgi:hypothetical protein